MARKNEVKSAVRFLKDCDDMIHIVTGKRIKDFVSKGIDVFGEDLKKKVANALTGEREEEMPNSPYRVLHCRPDAADIVVKGRFRLLVKELHPDTGTHPDQKEYQRVIEAYDQICQEREIIK